MLSTGELVVQAAQIAMTAIGTYLACFATVSARLDRAHKALDQERKESDDLGQRIAELETECYAAKRQREHDLERWSDGLAASFGKDLEDATERLMVAMLACKHGEDVTSELFAIHDDLCMVVGEMLSMCPDEDDWTA